MDLVWQRGELPSLSLQGASAHQEATGGHPTFSILGRKRTSELMAERNMPKAKGERSLRRLEHSLSKRLQIGTQPPKHDSEPQIRPPGHWGRKPAQNRALLYRFY